MAAYAYRYYYCNNDGDPSSKMFQIGVFRTNCIDCLDR